MFISKLDKTAGFFSNFFFLLNHYLFALKYELSFQIDSGDWLYKSNEGWTDYFEEFSLTSSKPDSAFKIIKGHSDHIERFRILEYIYPIRLIYKYNEKTKEEIEKMITHLGLKDGKYDAIYIRRGDKLASEGTFKETAQYIDVLLKKSPECDTVFLQTDDYQCFLDLEKYIQDNQLKIRAVTTCNQNVRGSVTHGYYKDILKNVLSENKRNSEYIKNIMPIMNETKAVENMDSDEIYNHTIELLTGLDICRRSNACVTDYQSNVGRFIKLAHENGDRVFDVSNPDNDIDYLNHECPAYHF